MRELVHHDRGGAAAHINFLERITAVGQATHFLAHGLEVFEGAVPFKRKAVERAVGAKHLAERDVHVQHVVLLGIGVWQRHTRRRVELEVLAAQKADDTGKHFFCEHGVTPAPLP